MCWNQQVSLNTFLFSSFILLLIIYNNTYTQYKIKELNNIWIYLFIASFILIQLVEFFIWRNIKNTFYNRLFSSIALIILSIQPIASLMILKNNKIKNILVTIYITLAAPFVLYQIITKQIKSEISINGHLKYYKLDQGYYIYVIWLFFFLFSFVYEKYWIGFFLAFVTLMISYYNYINDNTVGSMWCWFANITMIYYACYLLIYLPFNEKNRIC